MGGSLSRKSEAGRQKEVWQEGLRVSQKQTSSILHFFQGPALCHAETILEIHAISPNVKPAHELGENTKLFQCYLLIHVEELLVYKESSD